MGRNGSRPEPAQPKTDSPDSVEVRLLGAIEAWRDGRQIDLKGSKQRTLLTALALEANHVVPDDRLIDLLWPDEPPDTANEVLRVHVSKLRRAMEPCDSEGEVALRGIVVRRSSGYKLSIPADHVDLSRCRQLVAEARQLTDMGDDEGALHLLEEALALWRGDPLPELGNEPFAVGERSQMEKLRLETQEQRFEASLRLGRHTAVIGELEQLAARHPLRERLQVQLILALYRCGRQAEASDVYHRTRQRLSDDLGMEPGPELQARFRDILNQDPSASPEPEPPRPRTRAVEWPAGHGNLPVGLSSFVGREHSVEELTRLLHEHRLLTLVGPGGIGKTRLALQVAAGALGSFRDGVWLTDLAVAEPTAVAQAILASLGVRPFVDTTPEKSLEIVLQERSLLLVLDNCERVVDAVAAAVLNLLHSCPHVTILVTSRERLDIAAEQVWPVPPLDLPVATERPSAASLLTSDAVRLFMDRARMARPSFTVNDGNAVALAEICTRLDGIPLALELAAARLSALGPEELLVRLGDRFRLLADNSRRTVSRHSTMHDTIEWSSALLSKTERTLFHRLGVFAGSFTLRAVEDVCCDDVVRANEAAGLMARLVDKSLVVFEPPSAGEGRYRLLETMREYVHEQLPDAQRDAGRDRHARHYLEHGLRCERIYLDSRASVALQRYHAEYANARLALEWTSQTDPEQCLMLAGAWRFYWWMQGLLTEGRQWLERALAAPVGTPSARARALSGLGRLVAIQEDPAAAVDLFTEGLELAIGATDDFMIAELTHSIGVVLVGGETNDRAEAYSRTAVAMWERLGYREGLAIAQGNLGESCFYAGKYDEARARYQQQIEMGQEMSRFFGLVNLSHLECFLERFAEARAAATEALRLATPLYAAVVIEAFMFLAAVQEQPVRTATLSAAATRLYALRGAKPDPMPHRAEAEATVREVIGQLDEERLTVARQRGSEMSLDEVTEYALADPSHLTVFPSRTASVG